MSSQNDLGLRGNLDCLLLVLPRILPTSPTPGVAVLKSLGERSGLKIQTIDLNVRLWHLSKEFRKIWNHDDVSFFFEPEFEQLQKMHFNTIVLDWVEQIMAASPRWVGLSCLSYQSALFCRMLCLVLKETAPEIKIVLGGPGTYSFGAALKKEQLVDVVIFGQGERQFLDIFEIKDLSFEDLEIIPSYDDFDFDQYVGKYQIPFDPEAPAKGLAMLFITGSTGCVRHCSFCDVRDIWKKYSFRSANKVYQEIVELNRRYNVRHFFFTDSLMNGVQEVFNQFCKGMELLNQQRSLKITFEGYLVCRSEKQIPKEKFDLMAKAGLSRIYLGIESGSPSVREHMKKGYKQEDLLYFIEQCSRTGIEISMLLMVGYPTETHEDFLATLNMISNFYDRGWLGVGKTISTASFNWTTVIPGGTPLDKQRDALNIKESDDGFGLWQRSSEYISTAGVSRVENNTPELRVLRYKLLTDHLQSKGITTRNVENALQGIEQAIFKQTLLNEVINKISFKLRSKQASRFDKDVYFSWKPDVIGSRVFSNIYFLFNPETGELHQFTGIEADVCQLIDDGVFFEEILIHVTCLDSSLCADEKQTSAFIFGFLTHLKKSKLLQIIWT